MPLQILPQEGSFGKSLGTGLGTGLGELLGGLAQGKAQQRGRHALQQQEESALAPLLGQQQAHALAHASPEIKRYLVQGIMKGLQANAGNQDYANYLASKGIEPEEFMNLPKNVQNMELKKKLNPGFWRSLGEYVEGNTGMTGPASNVLRQAVNPSRKNEISKDEAEELRKLGYDVPLPNESTPLGQLLSSGAIGIGSGMAALRPEFLAQNLLSLGTGGVNWLGKLFGAENNLLTPYEELSSGKGNPQMRALYEQLQNNPKGAELLKNPALQAALTHKEGPQGLLPTSSQFVEGAKEATRGTPLEKYAIPQTEGQAKAERLGNAFAVIANPAKSFDIKNLAGTAKTAAKAAGLTLGGDAAGWMAEQATGSKKIGEIVRNGAWILGSIFPGTFGNLAQRKYNEWGQKVADKAASENKFVDMTKLRQDPKAEKLFENVQNMVQGSQAQQFVQEEAAVLDNLLNSSRVTPQALKDYISELGKMTKKASTPDQAKRYLGQMRDLLQDKLYKFSDQINPGGAQMLKDADRLYATGKGILDMSHALKKHLTKTVLLTPFLLFSGGYKALGSLGAAGVAGRYMSKLLNDPVSRKILTDLGKQSAGGNAAHIQKSFEMLDKRAKQLSPKDYEKLKKLREENEK